MLGKAWTWVGKAWAWVVQYTPTLDALAAVIAAAVAILEVVAKVISISLAPAPAPAPAPTAQPPPIATPAPSAPSQSPTEKPAPQSANNESKNGSDTPKPDLADSDPDCVYLSEAEVEMELLGRLAKVRVRGVPKNRWPNVPKYMHAYQVDVYSFRRKLQGNAYASLAPAPKYLRTVWVECGEPYSSKMARDACNSGWEWRQHNQLKRYVDLEFYENLPNPGSPAAKRRSKRHSN